MESFIPGLKIPDQDVCHYHIHLLQPSRTRAQEVQVIVEELHAPWTKDYIWQDESFSLTINTDHTLSGRSRFGDCVEDEWLIVWILRELSRRCKDIYVHITDTDGEFLLIESAMHLPRWLDPDIAENRAWIKDGKFIIIPPSPTEILNKQCPSLTLDQALAHLRGDKEVLHNKAIQDDAFARIKTYPEQSAKEIHRAHCRVPRVLATMLHRAPSLIAHVSVTCYVRDAAQVAQFEASQRCLTDREVQDMVSTTIRFTRTLYAHLKGLKFAIPAWYPHTSSAKDLAAHELGCRVVCGLVLSQDDRITTALKEARENMMTDEDLRSTQEGTDSDDYLHVNFSELEDFMAGRGVPDETDAGDSDETIKKMVAQMQKFMNTESTFEGAEFSNEGDEDDEDDEYDEEDVEDGFGDEDMDFMAFLRSSVAGTSSLDALRATTKEAHIESASDSDDAASEGNESVGGMEEYMAAMDAELSSHGISSSNALSTQDKGKAKATTEDAGEDEEEVEEEDDEELKIDFTMAKNMLESMKSQGGMQGPAAGLFGRMGISLPVDESDVESLD